MIRQVLSTYNVQTARGRGRQSQSAKAVEQFNQYIQDNFIESQRNKLCYCINPRCTYVAKCEDPLRYDVNCICGVRFCFKCARSNHVPSTCDMMQQWEKMTKSESANFLWIQANTKKCPLFDWASHNDHFSCNTPANLRPSEFQASKAKEELDYSRFYYERVDEQKKSLRFAQNQLEDVQFKMKLFQTLHKCDEKVTEFIRESALTLVRCREFILHSYIFAYSIPRCQAKSLFEMQQGDLLASTEQLCKIQEGKIQQLDRMQMIHFSSLAQHHLDNLIKFFASEALGMIQIGEVKLTGKR
ncbi:MAG: putative ubiquitin-protein ligase [Streblomastix strix]|uniref:Putative ubiquitin-protein ligase n=1 Tax=Streblomastix strix TaxID=222440 RepID=A0A5J4V4L6_9EUKA|nr:MAG: putative ubiquitin-protein ligase [Streblomastix strix]